MWCYIAMNFVKLSPLPLPHGGNLQMRRKNKMRQFLGDEQCDQIWRNFKSLWQFLPVYFLSGKMLSLLWQICDIIGRIFIVSNGHVLKNNLTIWSHWWWKETLERDQARRRVIICLQWKHPGTGPTSLQCANQSCVLFSLSIIRFIQSFLNFFFSSHA